MVNSNRGSPKHSEMDGGVSCSKGRPTLCGPVRAANIYHVLREATPRMLCEGHALY